MKHRFHPRGAGRHTQSMMDAEQFKSFNLENGPSFMGGGRMSGLGDQSLESENVVMGYEQIVERMDENNTTLGGSAGFAK